MLPASIDDKHESRSFRTGILHALANNIFWMDKEKGSGFFYYHLSAPPRRYSQGRGIRAIDGTMAIASAGPLVSSDKYGLAKAEINIATMLWNEMRSGKIADQLNISLNTVAFHRKNHRKIFIIFYTIQIFIIIQDVICKSF